MHDIFFKDLRNHYLVKTYIIFKTLLVIFENQGFDPHLQV